MATNMYIRFEDPSIDAGGSTPGHENEVEVLSWNHGFSQPGSSTGDTRGAAQTAHQNLAFTKYLDGATHDLLRYCWSGRRIGKATLTCYRTDSRGKAVKYLEVLMEDVVISNYSISGGPGDIPVENVSLDYATVQYTYDQSKGVKHDLQSNRVE